MYSYNPEKFASLYNSELGQRLWEFLSRPVNVARLETVSELGKPAAVGAQEPLLEAFGEEVLVDRVKQMVGHMIRQILEQNGWVLDQGDVKVQSVPFSKAARYRRPDWFTFHAFRNTSNPRDVAITDRRQNATLPDDASWTYFATFASPLQASVAFRVHDIRQLRQDVLANGFKRVQIERMMRAP